MILQDTNEVTVSTSTMQNQSKNWAVVGGGILGLTTALRLAQQGQKVTVVESAPRLGGLTTFWELADITWDKFYHVILLSDSRLRDLLAEIELEHEIEWVQTRTGFYSGGRLHSLSTSIDFLFFPPLNLYQKVRLGATIFFGSKIRNWKKMEQILVGDWLKRWSGKSTYEAIWLPLLKSKLGNSYSRTSAAFIWSYIDRMYKARRSGMKREMFGYVPGGYRRILESLCARLTEIGVEFKTDAPLANVATSVHGEGLDITLRSQDRTETHHFDRVVMTIPSPVIAETSKGLSDEEYSSLKAVEYLGVVCTSLLLKQQLGGYYVTNITDPGVPLTGIIEMGTIVKPEKLGGHFLVYLPQYVLSDDERLQESDDVIHERCLRTLEQMYPDFNRNSVTAIKTARAKYVMALPTLSYSEKMPPLLASLDGLYFLNSARIVKGNLNVNETLELLEEEFRQVVWPNHLQLANKSHLPTE